MATTIDRAQIVITADDEAAQNSVSRLGDAARKVSTALISTGGAIVGAGLSAARAWAPVEQELTRAYLANERFELSFQEVRDAAFAMSSGTRHSVDTVANALSGLASAGIRATDSQRGMELAMRLSDISGFALARSVDTIKIAYELFTDEVEGTARILDVMTHATLNNLISMDSLQTTFGGAASQASALGLGYEDLVNWATRLYDVNLRGYPAATAMNAILRDMASPTDAASEAWQRLAGGIFDADGAMRPFPELIAALNEGLYGMTEEQRAAEIATLGTATGVAALLPLLDEGGQGLAAMTTEFYNYGAAAHAQDVMNHTASASLEVLQNDFRNVKLAIGEALIPVLQEAGVWLGRVRDFVVANTDTITTWAPRIFTAGTAMLALGTAIQGVTTAARIATGIKGTFMAIKVGSAAAATAAGAGKGGLSAGIIALGKAGIAGAKGVAIIAAGALALGAAVLLAGAGVRIMAEGFVLMAAPVIKLAAPLAAITASFVGLAISAPLSGVGIAAAGVAAAAAALAFRLSRGQVQEMAERWERLAPATTQAAAGINASVSPMRQAGQAASVLVRDLQLIERAFATFARSAEQAANSVTRALNQMQTQVSTASTASTRSFETMATGTQTALQRMTQSVTQSGSQQSAAFQANGRALGQAFVTSLNQSLQPASTVTNSRMMEIRRAFASHNSAFRANGQALGDAFAAGLQVGFDRAVQNAQNAMNRIRRLMPSSPAKDGPFSGSGYPLLLGEKLMEDFGRGLDLGGNTATANAAAAMADISTNLNASSQRQSVEVIDYQKLARALAEVISPMIEGYRNVEYWASQRVPLGY